MSEDRDMACSARSNDRTEGAIASWTGADRQPGDVLDYVSDRHHCREGIAVVQDDGRTLDTFWSGGDRHCLSGAELATARLRFRLGDFRALGESWDRKRDEWLTYAPDDRRTITRQHGLDVIHYVRIGAEPDHATQVENARDRVAEAEEEVRAAQSRLTWRLEELAALDPSSPTLDPQSERRKPKAPNPEGGPS